MNTLGNELDNMFYKKPEPQSLVNEPQIISTEESLKRIEELETKMLDIIINYYKGVLSKGIDIIKTETVISDLEEIKKAICMEW